MFKLMKSSTMQAGQSQSDTANHDQETLAYMQELGARIVRIETTLCKLCLHVGMDPRTGRSLVGQTKDYK